MKAHLERHDVNKILERTCGVDGCPSMSKVFIDNRNYHKHEVCMALETNGTFIQLTIMMSHLDIIKGSSRGC
jgi:hypothetical protein